MQRALGAGVQALRQLVERVGNLVTPAALLTGLGPDLAGGGPEAERTVTDREYRGDHTASFELAQHRFPAFSAFAIAVLDRQQLLLAVGKDTDHHQRAEPIII